MADFVSLVSSLTTARDAAKGLLEIKSIAESAEARIAIAELQNALADTKGEIADLKLELLSKDEDVRALEAKLAERAELVRHNEMYFEADDNGNPIGDPYCPRCHEADSKLIHLVRHGDYRVKCPDCNKIYPRVPGEGNRRQTVAITNRNRNWPNGAW